MSTPSKKRQVERKADIMEAARHIHSALACLGYDTNSDASTLHTPRRIACYYDEVLRNAGKSGPDIRQEWDDEGDFQMTEFPATDSSLLLIQDIEFSSVCAHHFLPFYGKAAVAYVINKKMLGLSKIPRIVDWFSQRPQTQETLTRQIAEFLRSTIDPLFVGVVLEASHTCVSCRGVRKVGSTTLTSSFLPYADHPTKAEMLNLLGR